MWLYHADIPSHFCPGRHPRLCEYFTRGLTVFRLIYEVSINRIGQNMPAYAFTASPGPFYTSLLPEKI